MSAPAGRDVAALEAAAAAADQAARAAATALQTVQTAAQRRASQLQTLTAEAGLDLAAVRDLADHVRHADPAAIESAAIEAAKAGVAAAKANHDLARAQLPALQAEAERLRGIAEEALHAWRYAQGVVAVAQDDLRRGAGMGDAAERLKAAEDAARRGAEQRLAELTGRTTPAATATRDAGRNDFGLRVHTAHAAPSQ